MRILIIGKPRAGKTTLAKSLEERLDLVRIAPEVWIQDLFKRIQDRIDNPPEEPEMETDTEAEDEAARQREEAKAAKEAAKAAAAENAEEADNAVDPPAEEEEEEEAPAKIMREKRWLDDLETSVRDTFWAGKALTSQQVDEIMVRQIRAEKAQTKGFVLDMDFSKAVERSWAQRFQESGMLDNNEITHIVELHLEDDEVKLRAEHLRSTPNNGLVYSRWQRNEFAKKKPVKYDDEGNPIEEDEEPEEEDDGLPRVGKPLDENLLVARECDSRENIIREIDYYSLSERPAFDDLIVKLYDSTFVKVDCAGMTPTELSDVVTYRLKPNVSEPLRPIAVALEEGAGDFKALLTEALVPEGVEDDNVLPR